MRRELPLADYTRPMFSTNHDADTMAAVLAVAGVELDLVGLGVHGPKNAVDKSLKGTRLDR